MNISFEGQCVLVTGGSRGIGKSVAEAFLENGAAQVVVTGKSETVPEWIDNHREGAGGALRYFSLDLSNENWPDQFSGLMESVARIDVCINNAGINSIHNIYEFPIDKLREILRVNLEAPIAISGMVSKTMIERSYGRIINIASIFGVVSRGMRSAYTASKAGLIGTTRTLSIELARHNVLVNAVSPGFIKTELTSRVLGEDGIREMESRIPMARLGEVNEIANVVLFLSSRQNSYISGENVVVDGGFIGE